MNEHLPYEDELSKGLNDLPIPDASGAWEDMKRRLDEEDRKRRTPIFFRSCLALAVVGSLLAGIVIFSPEKEVRSAESGERRETREERETERERGGNLKGGVWSVEGRNKKQETRDKGSVEGGVWSVEERNLTNSSIKTSTYNNTSSKGGLKSVARKSSEGKTSNSVTRTSIDKNTTPSLIQTGDTDLISKVSNNEQIDKRNSTPIKASSNPPPSTLHTSDSILPKTVIKDTLVVGVPLDKPMQAIDSVAVAMIGSGRKKKFSVTGGIALQQGIPVNGQSTVPYNYYGRKASISDYIPSVYLRLHYGKAFLQGEARHGAPQSVREVSFARTTTVDSNTSNLSERTTRLKKTYYHQLPLSLNYEISKSISVGTGFSYNIFQGAVTEEITRTYNASGTQNVKSQIQNIKGYKDSFLYKSQLQWIVHTEYSWKRLALGLRFTYDLEPYIRYTLPNGELKDEKNQTLQAILRFRIF